MTLTMATTVTVPLPKAATPVDAGCELGAYMSLPVSAYTLLPLPLGAKLSRAPALDTQDDGSLFALTIPRVQLFSLVVAPTIFVAVAVVPPGDARGGPCVLIRAADARVDGAWADQLGLNALFEIYGTTRFTWTGDDAPADGAAPAKPAICSVTDLRVGVDPPPPFSRISGRVLTRVGNAVLGAVCAQLQRVFVKALAADYARWARDADYRAARQAWGVQQAEEEAAALAGSAAAAAVEADG